MLKDNVKKAVVNTLKKITSTAMNSTCCIFAYQDKLPEKAKKLRKF